MADLKMTVLEAMEKKDWSEDFDCCESLTDELWQCFPTGVGVTEAGKKDWNDVLALVVEINFGNYVPACIQVGDSMKMARRAAAFVSSANGYCPSEDFDRWFVLR